MIDQLRAFARSLPPGRVLGLAVLGVVFVWSHWPSWRSVGARMGARSGLFPRLFSARVRPDFDNLHKKDRQTLDMRPKTVAENNGNCLADEGRKPLVQGMPHALE